MRQSSELSVLFVDDQESMRQMGYQALASLGFKDILVAKSGRDAVKKLSNTSVDLIISDVNMDDVDGIKLLQMVRSHPEMRRTPFIIATGSKNLTIMKQATKHGANNYVLKPFNAGSLRKKIEQIFGKLITS